MTLERDGWRPLTRAPGLRLLTCYRCSARALNGDVARLRRLGWQVSGDGWHAAFRCGACTARAEEALSDA